MRTSPGGAQRSPLTQCGSDRARPGLFGNDQEELISADPEKLERQNDAELDNLNERARQLKEARRG